MTLDIDFIRSQFPAFREPSLEGWAFFENAGGSYMCQQVLDRLMTYYTQTKVQPYYSYPASAEAGKHMDDSYRRLSAYLNIEQDELIFGPSTSQNVYVSIDDLDKLITTRTRLVAFPHASNVVAHVNPVQEIAIKAHSVGAILAVDGVSYAPHGLPDIQQMGVDIYLFSLYKTWGPHLGAMFVKKELMKQITNQSHFYYKDEPHYCLTPAGPDHAQIASAAGVADYLDAVYAHHFVDEPDSAAKGRKLQQLFSDYETTLLTPLLDFLKAREDVLIIGPDDPSIRAPTVAIVPLNKPVPAVMEKLEEQKLMVASGDFDVVRLLNEMKIDLDPGVIRMSLLHYTTRNEIDRLISGLTIALG